MIGPTFGEYVRAVSVAGARSIEYRADPTRHFEPDVDAIVETIHREQPRLIFLCNPNNPTGAVLNRDDLLALLDAIGDGLLVVDEAYRAFADNMPDVMDLLDDKNLLVLRSMTKDCGLAGLRLGYAVGPEPVIRALHRVRPPWNCNAIALRAGIAALSDEGHIGRARHEVEVARRYITEELRRLGIPAGRSSTNFLLVRVGHATAFRRALLDHAMCVRDCTSFGLPEYIRIGIRTEPDCARLIAAIEKVLHCA